ncbi:molybdopterin-synthase adenylyltransferase MoeB [Shewanella sp. SR44-3]|uniref:molybdopterin-synthase adenylyltransferase MoeB n=1 Tax=unclassified Shewanella TaxID=196818 RepID=UPI0015FC8980|nr:molybdopterin-synthase adenylyltransferase MoeB [Shewanella sp. SR44-3]MBB1268791.1 molybdopterin-synthase adenylyltransferase MoeB [Shewanella sp. SR44-3]
MFEAEILSHPEMMRYSRQISIKGVDLEGQEALKQAKVLIIGLGGLGCAASQYLAVAGVGELTLVDFDQVELSNLQRQVLHHDDNIGQNKVDSAKQSLQQLNPHIKLNSINAKLSQNELTELIKLHDLVLDCTDNLAIRQQLNLSCFNHTVPLVSGAAIRMEGTVTLFDYQESRPCYHCYSSLFGEQSLSCVEAGILAPVVGIVGAIQATEVIKYFTHLGQGLGAKVLLIDAMTMEFRQMKLLKNPLCPVCSASRN